MWCLFEPMFLQVGFLRPSWLLLLLLVSLFEMVLMWGKLLYVTVILVIKATCVLTRYSLSLDRPQSIFKKISQQCGIAVSLTYSCQSLMAAAGSAWAPRSPLSPSSGPGPSRKSYQSPWTTSPGGRFMKVAVFSSSAQKWPHKVAQLFWHILIEFSTKLGSPIFLSSVIWTHSSDVTMLLEGHFTYYRLEL